MYVCTNTNLNVIAIGASNKTWHPCANVAEHNDMSGPNACF